MTELFRNPGNLTPTHLEQGRSLLERATFHAIVRNDFERTHFQTWPADQQELMRALLIHSIHDDRAIVFDWEEAKTTSTTIMDFGDHLAVTFRSPRRYPPYSVP